MFRYVVDEFVDGHRFCVEVSLTHGTAERQEMIGLWLILDPFRDEGIAKVPAQIDHCGQKFVAGGIRRRDILQEHSVDLECVAGDGGEVLEVAVSRAEVIDGDHDALGAKEVDVLEERSVGGIEMILDDLDSEHARGDAGTPDPAE